MNIKKIVSLCCLIVAGFVFLSADFKGEKDPLHKRTFTLNFSEIKDGQPSKKQIPDEMSFKDGKLYSDYLAQKFSYKWIKYRINKDSIYTDETETEVRLFEVEATTTDEANTTLTINVKIEGWDIDGTVKMTKNDKPKKYFEITGFEKGGKPRKEKKKKGDPNPAGTMEEPKKE